MGCSESKYCEDIELPLISKNKMKYNDNDAIFNKFFQPISITLLRTSEEFIHDGHFILKTQEFWSNLQFHVKTYNFVKIEFYL